MLAAIPENGNDAPKPNDLAYSRAHFETESKRFVPEGALLQNALFTKQLAGSAACWNTLVPREEELQ
jgi:hypothetical protein